MRVLEHDDDLLGLLSVIPFSNLARAQHAATRSQGFAHDQREAFRLVRQDHDIACPVEARDLSPVELA